jgi:hypothetical protein
MTVQETRLSTLEEIISCVPPEQERGHNDCTVLVVRSAVPHAAIHLICHGGFAVPQLLFELC